MVQQVCPRCVVHITSTSVRSTEGCRMNGDAYGWIHLMCQACGLVQKEGWDEQ